jgi:hypothetical protein
VKGGEEEEEHEQIWPTTSNTMNIGRHATMIQSSISYPAVYLHLLNSRRSTAGIPNSSTAKGAINLAFWDRKGVLHASA